MAPAPARAAASPIGIARATLTVLLGSAVGLAAALAVRILVARTLPPAQVGTLVLAMAISSALAGVATLGLGQALGRRVAARRAVGDVGGARQSAASGMSLALASGVAAALFLLAAAPVLQRAFDIEYLAASVAWLAPFVLVFPIGSAAVGVGRAWDDALGRAAIREAAGGVLRVAGVACGVGFWPDSRGAAAGYAVGALLGEGAYAAFIYSRKWVARTGMLSRDADLVRELPPYWLMMASAQLEAWLDVMLLGLFAPAATVAFYGMARGLVRAVRLVEYAASHSFLPQAAALLARGDTAAHRRIFMRTRVLVFALQWPALALCMFAPEFVMRVVFGATYAFGGSALRIIGIAATITAVVSAGKDQTLLAAGKATRALTVDGVALSASALVLLWLAPAFFAVGAAIAVLSGAVVRGFGLTWFVVRNVKVLPLRCDLHPLPLAAVGTCVAWQMIAAALALSPALHAATVAAWACWGSALCAAALWTDHRRPGSFFPSGAREPRGFARNSAAGIAPRDFWT